MLGLRTAIAHRALYRGSEVTKKFLSLTSAVLSSSEREALVRGVLEAPYFGASVLGPEFLDTKGFSLVFRRSAIKTVYEEFPYLSQLLEKALFDDCNAFYINPLVMRRQSQVDTHIDCRLTTKGERVIPNLVSVFYAEVHPEMIGGGIVFRPDQDDEVRVCPEAGDLLHFIGSTLHRVEAISSDVRRISVVCEQYNLTAAQLEGFPECEVLTDRALLARTNAFEGGTISAEV